MTEEMIIPREAIQEQCLKIANVVDRICRSNNVEYSLCGGSAIGAYVYNGFIPWDDDIDLMMTRNNYEKFLKYFDKEAPKGYRLLNYRSVQSVNVPTLFSRIEKTDVDVVEKIAGKIRKGHAFVDITVMDNIPTKIMHRTILIYGAYIYAKLYKINGMCPSTWWKRLLFNLAKMNGEKKVFLDYKKYESICAKYKDKNTVYCAELLSAAYSGYLYKREWFDKYEDILFEGCSFRIIHDYMEYLYTRYGKKEFPKDIPEEQRFNTHIL